MTSERRKEIERIIRPTPKFAQAGDREIAFELTELTMKPALDKLLRECYIDFAEQIEQIEEDEEMPVDPLTHVRLWKEYVEKRILTHFGHKGE